MIYFGYLNAFEIFFPTEYSFEIFSAVKIHVRKSESTYVFQWNNLKKIKSSTFGKAQVHQKETK